MTGLPLDEGEYQFPQVKLLIDTVLEQTAKGLRCRIKVNNSSSPMESALTTRQTFDALHEEFKDEKWAEAA